MFLDFVFLDTVCVYVCLISEEQTTRFRKFIGRKRKA